MIRVQACQTVDGRGDVEAAGGWIGLGTVGACWIYSRALNRRGGFIGRRGSGKELVNARIV